MTQAAHMPEWMKARLAGTREAPGEIELAPDEVDAVALFTVLGTQWRLQPMTGKYIGLDYAAVQPAAAMAGIAMSPGLFSDLRTMEAAALDAWAGKSAAAGASA